MSARLGFVMMVHDAFDRAEQVARHWAAAGCPVVIHVDAKVTRPVADGFRARLADVAGVSFCDRVRVEWGTWSLVRATQIGARALLDRHGHVRHVYLVSGSCLPLRPVGELAAYLDARPDTDFIESVTIDEVTWTVDGLEAERFTLRFPFGWRRQRRLFDAAVTLQRRLGLERAVPDGLTPHMGSQWWCLTRATLEGILNAPDRAAMDRYFRRVWIPDESYFQTLARRHARAVESRSLTLAKFDVQGKPHLFYDDHRPLLERSDCFVARKIWRGADGLYRAFLDPDRPAERLAEPDPARIDRVFARANERRRNGRAGLLNQGRFPDGGGETAGRYAVFWGLDDLFDEWEPWLARAIGGRVHGHLYHPDGAQFAGREDTAPGCLSSRAELRDWRPRQFLQSLIWNTRGERQAFQHGPGDVQVVSDALVWDPNATIAVVSGAWAVPLMLSGRPFDELRPLAARLQRAEAAFLVVLSDPRANARVHRWSLAEFAADPGGAVADILADLGAADPRGPAAPPAMRDLSGLPAFVQTLRDAGLRPVTIGDLGAMGGRRRRRARNG
jgi:hypothetical protein